MSKRELQIIDSKSLISKRGFVRRIEAPGSAWNQLETAGIWELQIIDFKSFDFKSLIPNH
jgi:hypothetical protein